MRGCLRILLLCHPLFMRSKREVVAHRGKVAPASSLTLELGLAGVATGTLRNVSYMAVELCSK